MCQGVSRALSGLGLHVRRGAWYICHVDKCPRGGHGYKSMGSARISRVPYLTGGWSLPKTENQMKVGELKHMAILVCPNCKMSGKQTAQIGSNSKCKLCRKFTTQSNKLVLKFVQSNHAELYQNILNNVKLTIYPDIIQQFEEYQRSL